MRLPESSSSILAQTVRRRPTAADMGGQQRQPAPTQALLECALLGLSSGAQAAAAADLDDRQGVLMRRPCLLCAQSVHIGAQAAAADLEERQGVLVPDDQLRYRADDHDAAAGRLGRHIRQCDQFRRAVRRLPDAVVRGPRHAQAAPQRAGAAPLCWACRALGPVVQPSSAAWRLAPPRLKMLPPMRSFPCCCLGTPPRSCCGCSIRLPTLQREQTIRDVGPRSRS